MCMGINTHGHRYKIIYKNTQRCTAHTPGFLDVAQIIFSKQHGMLEAQITSPHSQVIQVGVCKPPCARTCTDPDTPHLHLSAPGGLGQDWPYAWCGPCLLPLTRPQPGRKEVDFLTWIWLLLNSPCPQHPLSPNKNMPQVQIGCFEEGNTFPALEAGFSPWPSHR